MVDVRRRVGAVAMVLVVAVLALSGCATHSGNNAAYVNGRAISDHALDQVVDGVAAHADASTTVNKQVVLAILVRGQVALAVASNNGITVTDGERDEYIAQQEKVNQNYQQLAVLENEPAASQVIYDLAYFDIVSQRLGGATQFVQAAQKVKVQVNPRYGEWVAEGDQVGIQANSSGSLAGSEQK